MEKFWNERTELLLDKEKLETLKNSHVLLCGLGGVGGAAAEMVARSGVGEMTLVDADIVEASNRNRQLAALVSSNGKKKTEVIAQRLRDINPAIKLNLIDSYVDQFCIKDLIGTHYDFAIDAIDTLIPKIELVAHLYENNIRFVSSMGAGGKIDPSKTHIADISQSYNCRLAKMLRKRLGRRGIRTGFPVVFSTEQIDKTKLIITDGNNNKKSVIGTISYMPNIFGCCCASVAIRTLINEKIDGI
ncbi:tRNA threonylcarbamoyladenosine dehydratase [Flammeovirgaceae bacterium SG7u.111]|nr:tRNA threonylcarbamoyladenosine dehydratase [Flammeovirgaceae bacterium SG7u.132]WPO37764.1 tRNA threonylcarbamoyladenosine dehydratase [Flammeovirgaceae bacterium SG7u.111]